jgi:predicted DsbA family dithiol-disulfide isomerase
MDEYQGRVRLRVRPFPLEVAGGEAVPRDILAQEWWLAALQEPAAPFAPYPADDWPTTTLPAFEAAWCAAQHGEDAYLAYDLRVRRAFFAEGRNIGRRDVLQELAQDVGLDLADWTRALDSGEARTAVLEECRLGRERYAVRGTPTVMLPDGTKVRPPIAFPRMRGRQIVGVQPLPCCGDACLDATRALFDRALQTASAQHTPEGERP